MATALFKPYRNFAALVENKEVDLDSDSITITLHTSTYSPNLDTHIHVSDLTNELSTAGGYTAGGITLTSLSRSYVAANSWATTAAVSTAYVVGDTRRPSTGNGFLYRCNTAGTSSGTAPTWPTVVQTTVTDGSVGWTNMGGGASVFDAADSSWSTFTATGIRYAILSDRSTGTTSTEPLIAIADFGSDQSGGGGTWTVQYDVTGILIGFVLD